MTVGSWGGRIRREKLELGREAQGKGFWKHVKRDRDLGVCGGLEHGVWEVGALEHLGRECVLSGCGGWE